MHVEQLGDRGPRLLLVHGSVAPGWATWSAQRELADEGYQLVVPHRTGYPPNPPLDFIDFDVQAREIAELIEPGTHVVGHSYGGVVSLLAVALVSDRVRSLAVIEPPALGLARGHPRAEALIADVESIRDNPGTMRDAFARFVASVGSNAKVPETLSTAQEASIRATLAERPPFEATFDWAAIRAGGFPVLVVSGDHDPAFEAICDVVARQLSAERAVIPGAGHSVQRTGGAFNRRLRAFVDAAESRGGGSG
jgi:pimeloyl-ACP methyl ester carboxylesterase